MAPTVACPAHRGEIPPVRVSNRLLLEAAAIVAMGIGVGGLFHVATGAGPQATYTDIPVKQVSLEDTKHAFDAGEAIFLDARFESAYEAGHIPGARSLPLYQFDAVAEQVLAGVRRGHALITYCQAENCDSAERLAEKLVRRGHRHTRVFTGGWAVWSAAGYPSRPGGAP